MIRCGEDQQEDSSNRTISIVPHAHIAIPLHLQIKLDGSGGRVDLHGFGDLVERVHSRVGNIRFPEVLSRLIAQICARVEGESSDGSGEDYRWLTTGHDRCLRVE